MKYPKFGDGRLPERFWDKVILLTDGCWLWIASDNGHGYGRFRWEGRLIGAHHLAYQEIVGKVPEGLQLDHLCRKRACVNPLHLEPVTPSINVKRGVLKEVTLGRFNEISHCPKGHEYTQDNTYVYRNTRACKKCHANREKERRRRLKENG